ncbi:MAG: hypothetical protein RIQ60_1261 [Pseudomonadota bacterium]|jgi:hypothetical protein
MPTFCTSRRGRTWISNATTALGLMAGQVGAQAHEGHGLPGVAHWHATDSAGLLLVVGLFVVGLWLLGRK